MNTPNNLEMPIIMSTEDAQFITGTQSGANCLLGLPGREVLNICDNVAIGYSALLCGHQKFINKVCETHRLLNNLYNKDAPIRILYYVIINNKVRPLSKDEYELTSWGYDYHIANIFDLPDGKIFTLGQKRSKWIYIVTTEDDFINYREENFETYTSLSDYLIEHQRQLIAAITTLNEKLPDCLKGDDPLMILENIGTHFECEIGGDIYENAKQDFESNSLKS